MLLSEAFHEARRGSTAASLASKPVQQLASMNVAELASLSMRAANEHLQITASRLMKRVFAEIGLDGLLARTGSGVPAIDDFRLGVSQALTNVGLRPDTASVVDGLVDELRAGIADRAASPKSELRTPMGGKAERRLTDTERLWISVIVMYLAIVLIQHVASFIGTTNPEFDPEKFVSHHVQALGVALGFYAILAGHKRR